MALKTFFQTFTTDQLGQIFLTGPLNVEAFSKVNLQILAEAAVNMTVECGMGKFSGERLAQRVGQLAFELSDLQIHTFEVIGPEFSGALTGGPPITDFPIQRWVYLPCCLH